MNPQVSTRLDLLRALAALSVFCSHFAQLGIAGTNHETLWAFGRIGVMAFFVMSGYVIAYVAEHKHHSLRHYTEARFARLFSVFLPALLLTLVLDTVGRYLDASLYAKYPAPDNLKTLLYAPFFLSFLFENSAFSLRWFSNGPVWSIAYEFWYYIIFGLCLYLRGRERVVLLLFALLLAGWKILLLMPVWASGVLLYRYRVVFAARLASYSSWIFWASGICLAVLLTPAAHLQLTPLREWGGRYLPYGFHSAFLSDYVFALPVFTLLLALVIVPQRDMVATTFSRIAAWAAGFSFSLYLFHVPLIVFARATHLYAADSVLQSMVAAFAVLLCCYLLAQVTEQRKSVWLRWVQVCANALITNKQRIFKNA